MNDPFIGMTFGNYRIERLLGRGGMARVYLGWDQQLARSVAIKILDEPYREQPGYTERFLREARAMAAWIHPHIVKVHSAGVEHGITYYVMEYIHGHDLAQVMRQYAAQGLLLPYSEVIRVGRAVASALDYAHQEGIVHRDVKPSNVLIAEDGRIMLTDFGLAMNVAEGTMGEVFGSPQYISPEQARSSAYAVAQSDLYSLGVMLFELLTGHLPFNDPYPATLALMHINDPVPDPLQINPALPIGVGTVLRRALSKNPAERPAGGAEMMDTLETALHAGEEVTAATLPLPRTPGISEPTARTTAKATTARPPAAPPPLPPVRPAQRSRFPGCALIAVLLLILTGAAVALVLVNGGLPLAGEQVATAQPSATQPGSILEETDAEPPATATVEPSRTPTETPEPTLTATATATEVPPTFTPSPTLTPEIDFYELDLVIRGQNLFVINRGILVFPIQDLTFEAEGEGELHGTVWDLEELQEDECVALWRSPPEDQAPDNLRCELVGEDVQIDVPPNFWEEPIVLIFREERLGSCQFRNNRCEVEIPVDWGSTNPYP